jgi:hypothetical protein
LAAAVIARTYNNGEEEGFSATPSAMARSHESEYHQALD